MKDYQRSGRITLKETCVASKVQQTLQGTKLNFFKKGFVDKINKLPSRKMNLLSSLRITISYLKKVTLKTNLFLK